MLITVCTWPVRVNFSPPSDPAQHLAKSHTCAHWLANNPYDETWDEGRADLNGAVCRASREEFVGRIKGYAADPAQMPRDHRVQFPWGMPLWGSNRFRIEAANRDRMAVFASFAALLLGRRLKWLNRECCKKGVF